MRKHNVREGTRYVKVEILRNTLTILKSLIMAFANNVVSFVILKEVSRVNNIFF